MTERLTEEWYDDMEQFDRYAPKSPNIEINCGGDGFQRIIDKLAEYETAEEEGRLVVLPCKVGEEIYAIYTGSTGKNPTIMRTSFDYGLIPYFGKSVFLSYEEAEKALEEMEKDE